MKKITAIGIAVLVLFVTIVVVWNMILWHDAAEMQKIKDWYIDYGERTYNEEGCLYANDGYLHYLDAEAGEDVLICNDATCEHKKEECSAYFESGKLIGIEENKKLLLITDYKADKMGELYLYEASVNGENRKKIAKLSDNIQFITDTKITEGHIIIAYYNQYDENHEDLALPVAGIYVYDRNTGEGKTIHEIEMCNARILSMAISEDEEIYYSFIGYDVEEKVALEHREDFDFLQKYLKSAIYRIGFSGKGNRKMQDSDAPTTLMLYHNSYFYNDGGVLYAYDTKKGDVQKIGEEMQLIPTCQKDVMYFSKYDTEKKKSLLYRYDGRLEELGTIGQEWNLCAVFGHVAYAFHYDDEKEDSTMVCMKAVEDVLE